MKQKYNCIYGFRRLAACTKLGHTKIMARDVDSGSFLNIDIEDINHQDNSRIMWEKEDVSQLMLSIRDKGLLENIGVRKIGKGNKKTNLLLNLIENFQRKDPHVYDLGMAIKKLVENQNMSVDEMATAINISSSKVKDLLGLVSCFSQDDLEPVIMCHDGIKIPGKISVTVAQIIANATARQSEAITKEFLKQAKKEDLTTSEANSIGNLIKAGLSVEEAMARRKVFKRRSINVVYNSKICVERKLNSAGKLRKYIRDILTVADPELFKI